MIRLAIFLLGIFILVVGVYIYFNPEETFEAKFKNIDGLPKGAPVTALGVKIGEVIKTKSTEDGVLVTVRITNKSLLKPPPGSRLAITSFRPNQGRVLEIVPSDENLGEKAYIIQEPITNESWLHASLDILDNLKEVSGQIIKYVTPENFEKARTAFSRASESLNETANNLLGHESDLINMKQKLAKKTSDANELLVRLRSPIASLNKVINNKNITTSFKGDLMEFSDNLTKISQNISKPEVINDIKAFKTDILNHLNEVNDSLTLVSNDLVNSDLSKNLMDFNTHVEKLNAFYDEVNKKDLEKPVKDLARKARETTTMLAEKTSNF
jgi:predicted translin family RNA/ssDNA-binding protein